MVADRGGRMCTCGALRQGEWVHGASGLLCRTEPLCDSRQHQSSSDSADRGCFPLIVHPTDSEFVDTHGSSSTVVQPALTGSACCSSRCMMTADSYMHSFMLLGRGVCLLWPVGYAIAPFCVAEDAAPRIRALWQHALASKARSHSSHNLRADHDVYGHAFRTALVNASQCVLLRQ